MRVVLRTGGSWYLVAEDKEDYEGLREVLNNQMVVMVTEDED